MSAEITTATGHGGSCNPDRIQDILALDVACVGPENNSDEMKVSIFVKEPRFSYHREMIKELVETAKKHDINYVIDTFAPTYGTDCEDTIIAGYDVRHGAVGPGTFATHGYERTHTLAVQVVTTMEKTKTPRTFGSRPGHTAEIVNQIKSYLREHPVEYHGQADHYGQENYYDQMNSLLEMLY